MPSQNLASLPAGVLPGRKASPKGRFIPTQTVKTLFPLSFIRRTLFTPNIVCICYPLFSFFQPCCSFSSSISFSSNALKLFICVHFSRQSSSPESPSTSSGRRKVHLPSNQGRGAAKQSSMGRKIVRGFEDFQRNKSDPLAGLSARILNKNRKRDVAGIKKKRNFQRKSSHKWL